MAKTFNSQTVKVRNSTTKEFESLLSAKGEKGDKGDIGESGIQTQTSGFFTLSVDENGDLWVHYADNDTTPPVELDTDGNIYYTVPD